MKKIALIVSTLIMSSSVFAATQTTTYDKVITSQGHSTEAQALEAGYDIMESINAKSPEELTENLMFSKQDIVKNSARVKSVEVGVEKYSQSRGDIKYRAIVDVDYEYKFIRDRR